MSAYFPLCSDTPSPMSAVFYSYPSAKFDPSSLPTSFMDAPTRKKKKEKKNISWPDRMLPSQINRPCRLRRSRIWTAIQLGNLMFVKEGFFRYNTSQAKDLWRNGRNSQNCPSPSCEDSITIKTLKLTFLSKTLREDFPKWLMIMWRFWG